MSLPEWPCKGKMIAEFFFFPHTMDDEISPGKKKKNETNNKINETNNSNNNNNNNYSLQKKLEFELSFTCTIFVFELNMS